MVKCKSKLLIELNGYLFLMLITVITHDKLQDFSKDLKKKKSNNNNPQHSANKIKFPETIIRFPDSQIFGKTIL